MIPSCAKDNEDLFGGHVWNSKFEEKDDLGSMDDVSGCCYFFKKNIFDTGNILFMYLVYFDPPPNTKLSMSTSGGDFSDKCNSCSCTSLAIM